MRTQAQFIADRAKVLAGMGQYSRACQALSSRGMADSTDEVRAMLQAKHPLAAGPMEHEERVEGTDSVEFSKEQVGKALWRFKQGSALGLDGMRVEHLQQGIGNINNA